MINIIFFVFFGFLFYVSLFFLYNNNHIFVMYRYMCAIKLYHYSFNREKFAHLTKEENLYLPNLIALKSHDTHIGSEKFYIDIYIHILVLRLLII